MFLLDSSLGVESGLLHTVHSNGPVPSRHELPPGSRILLASILASDCLTERNPSLSFQHPPFSQGTARSHFPNYLVSSVHLS